MASCDMYTITYMCAQSFAGRTFRESQHREKREYSSSAPGRMAKAVVLDLRLETIWSCCYPTKRPRHGSGKTVVLARMLTWLWRQTREYRYGTERCKFYGTSASVT